MSKDNRVYSSKISLVGFIPALVSNKIVEFVEDIFMLCKKDKEICKRVRCAKCLHIAIREGF